MIASEFQRQQTALSATNIPAQLFYTSEAMGEIIERSLGFDPRKKTAERLRWPGRGGSKRLKEGRGGGRCISLPRLTISLCI